MNRNMAKENNNPYNNFSNNNRPRYSSSKSDSGNNYFLNQNKNKKIVEKTFVLKEDMFPVLSVKEELKNQTNTNINTNHVFSSFFKMDPQEEEEEEEDMDLKNEKERWITIKKGIPYSPKKEKNKLEQEENQEVKPYKVFEKLTKLYENWKKNYIEQWGYDEYEKNYRFPNYDYSYLESEEEEMNLYQLV